MIQSINQFCQKTPPATHSECHNKEAPLQRIMCWILKTNEPPLSVFYTVTDKNLIGSGGYSNVYKYSISLGHLAIKIDQKIHDNRKKDLAKIRDASYHLKNQEKFSTLINDLNKCSDNSLLQEYLLSCHLNNTDQHPHLPKINAYGYMDNTLQKALVMDLYVCDFHSFLKKINPQNQKNLTPLKILWLKQLISTIDFIHKKGVFHHDLKTANLFIKGNGELVVGDFGIASFKTDNTFSTYSSLPPEAAGIELGIFEKEGFEHLSRDSDLWAFFLILTEFIAHGSIYNRLRHDFQIHTKDDFYRFITIVGFDMIEIATPMIQSGVFYETERENLIQMATKGFKRICLQRYQSAAEIYNHIDVLQEELKIHAEHYNNTLADFLNTTPDSENEAFFYILKGQYERWRDELNRFNPSHSTEASGLENSADNGYA